MQINPKTGLPFKTTPKRRETASKNRIASKRTTRGRAVVLVNNARARSLKKNISMELSPEWVEEHLKRGTCELTGLPFSFEPPPEGVTRRPDAPSLDRINKHEHYTEDNTRVILWAVNCALAEYGTEIMLPILEATIKGIKDAQSKSATPVSTGYSRESKDVSKHGIIFTPRTWKNYDHADNHSGTVRGQDADHSPQTSGGDGMGCGGKEVGPPQASQSEQDNGISYGKIVSYEELCRHLFDKP